MATWPRLGLAGCRKEVTRLRRPGRRRQSVWPPADEPTHAVTACKSRADGFPETRWSVIAGAQAAEPAGVLPALDLLARAYWKPLYCYVRSTGCSHAQAADAVQGFFASVFSRETLRRVAPSTTRFRVFLLVCLKNWLASDARRATAAKRGGSQQVLEPLHELPFDIVPPALPETTPSEALDRAWAREVFDRAFARLAEDAARRGRAEMFGALRPILFGASVEGGFCRRRAGSGHHAGRGAQGGV